MTMISKSTELIPARPRLHFLDGTRGLTALYVMQYHMWTRSWDNMVIGSNYPLWYRALSLFRFGHEAVTIFIVLSGFSLMLPIANVGGSTLTTTTKEYFIRRCRRILPPYYAALILFVLLTVLLPSINSTQKLSPGSDFWPALFAHIFLVHNVSLIWVNSFDPPMWSVATEWQIYFLFPLLLLPLRRQFGTWAAVAAGFAIGALSLVFKVATHADYWYIGSFALGALAAEHSFGPKSDKWSSVTWGRISAGTFVFWLIVVGLLLKKHLYNDQWSEYATDILVALAAASTFVYLSKLSTESHVNKTHPGLLFNILSSRIAVALGAFSYSIYLVHYPLLVVASSFLKKHAVTTPHLYIALLILSPIVIGLCYLFHLAFERRFMNLPKAVPQSEFPITGVSAKS